MEIKLGLHKDVTHRFQPQGEIDLSGFPQGRPVFVEAIDLQDLSQFCNAAQEGLAVENLAVLLRQSRHPDVSATLQAIAETGSITPISSSVLPEEMYHAACNVFVSPNGQVVDKVEQTQSLGYYGSDTRVSYFSADRDAALTHGLGNFNVVTERRTRFPKAMIVMLTLDTQLLSEKRNLFPDPESLLPAFEHEFGQNFIVHSGIPVSAIKKMELLSYAGYSQK